MKLFKFIIICIIIFSTSIISQDSSVVSLTIGNTWIYNYSKTTSSDPTIFGTQVKEIIGDTTISILISTCDSSYFVTLTQLKTIKVRTNINNVINYKTEYWYTDSTEFLKNSRWYSQQFRYVFNDYQTGDTICYGFFGEDFDAEFLITLEEDSLWGSSIETQKWSVSWHFPTSPSNESLETITTYYYGPISEQYSSSDVFGGWVEKTSILKGAIIDGMIYGDTTVVSVSNVNGVLPTKFILFQNYPNPFNPTTKINYEIPERSFVTLKVYDVLGNEITILVNEEKPAGSYEVEFSVRQNSILSLSSGIYFYKLRAGNYIETKKMVLLK